MFSYLYDQQDRTGHMIAAGRPTCDEAFEMVETVSAHPELPATRKFLVDLRQYTAIPRMDVLSSMTIVLRSRALHLLTHRHTAVVTVEGSQGGAARYLLDALTLPAQASVKVMHSLRDAQQWLGLLLVLLAYAASRRQAVHLPSQILFGEMLARTLPDTSTALEQYDGRQLAHLVSGEQRPDLRIPCEQLQHGNVQVRPQF